MIREHDAVAHAGFPLPRRTLLAAAADPGFDRIAGVVRQVIGVPVALVSLVDEVGQVFPGAVGLPAPFDAIRATPLSHSFCQHVVRSGERLIVADARTDPRLQDNLAIDDIGVVAYAGIPLADVDGTVLGSLCAIDTEPRVWTDSEIRLLADLAAACSAELQLRSVAATTEHAQQLAAVLLHLSETLSETTTLVEVAEALDSLARDHLGATFGGITLLDETGQYLTYVDRSSLPASFEPAYARFPITAATPSAAVVNTGEPLYFGDVETFVGAYPVSAGAITAGGASAGAYHPLTLGGRTLGVLTLLWAEPQPFEPDDKAMLAALGRYTAQAVQRAVLLADRHQVAETLQTAMLPALPSLPWLELAGRYLPARAHDAVGGDWYDAFELQDGALALSVGDVEGHDTIAAAVMGQVRSTVRALTVTAVGGPARVLAAVDDVFAALPPARYATGVVATLTRTATGGDFTWTNAAHPSPLVAIPGRPAELLTTEPQLPIGLVLRQPRAAHVHDLPPGTTVLLYTDGLIERRGRDYEVTIDELLRAVETHRDLPLADMVDAILAELVTGLGDDAHDDDVVLFGVRLPT